MRKELKILTLVVLTATIVLVPRLVRAQSKQISGGARFGCASQEYLDKLVGYIVQQDKAALVKGLSAGVAVEQCTMFTHGEEVFIADTAIFSGLVKVRRKGEVAEYWTATESVN